MQLLQIVKKLTGRASGTAAWMTNLGNEHGQVLISVLTTHEGGGLEPMLRGIIERYSAAEVSPPSLLYVDRDCCSSRTKGFFTSSWPELEVRSVHHSLYVLLNSGILYCLGINLFKILLC